MDWRQMIPYKITDVTKDQPLEKPALDGQKVYSTLGLKTYDLWVLGISNSFFWKCPTREILAHYNSQVTGNHLEVGVGTGYYPAKCKFPSGRPEITLLDLNETALHYARNKLQDIDPDGMNYRANVLEPLRIEKKFDSIALIYVLHCLPGTMAFENPDSKEKVFGNLKMLLNDGGVLFGATILHDRIDNIFGQKICDFYNDKGIFSNKNDTAENLKRILESHFSKVNFRIKGAVGIFDCRV